MVADGIKTLRLADAYCRVNGFAVRSTPTDELRALELIVERRLRNVAIQQGVPAEIANRLEIASWTYDKDFDWYTARFVDAQISWVPSKAEELLPYVRHTSGCGSERNWMPGDGFPCTCGLDRALEGVE